MKNLIYILLIILITPTDSKAQTRSDSLYVAKIDSIVFNRTYNKEYFAAADIKQIQTVDSIGNSTVIGRYKNGQLNEIYCLSQFDKCEKTFFTLLNDSLILVQYQLSDPDIRGSEPPNTRHTFYFRNNKQFFYSTSSYDGGARLCDSYDAKNKDFIKEYNYYKLLLFKQ